MLRRTIVLALLPAGLLAQGAKPASHAPDPWAVLLRPRTHVATPTTAAITEADLRTRLFAFADDSMGGRLAGTEGNYKGVEYIASEVKRFGLQPAGDAGTSFQTVHVPADTRAFDSTTTISVDGRELRAWTDYMPRDPFAPTRSLDGVQVIYGGTWQDSSTVISDADAAGKLVVIRSTVSVAGNPPGIPSRPDVTRHFRSAAGIAVVGLEGFPAATVATYRAPTQLRHQAGPQPAAAPAYLYVTHEVATALLGAPVDQVQPGAAGKTVHGDARFAVTAGEFTNARPLRNVVALLPGSDASLRGEYVVIGAHNDHIGTQNVPLAHDSIYVVNHLFRKGGADDPDPTLTAAQQQEVNSILARVRKQSGGRSARPDSIYNGADDDGSGSVSVLEIAQYFAAAPVKPKRSILFVWHVGEELGLWGSEYFTDHPTVPRDSIVAELNMDMVGRGGVADETGNSIDKKKLHGGPGYLQVVGSRRLSTELGDMAEQVNTTGHHGLHFDYAMDANGHPQNIYCRSDHYEYARYGIPIAFFTTGGHADYHQLTDEPQYIDYARMAQVDSFVADLARHVANADHRPVVDHAKPDPQGRCQQ